MQQEARVYSEELHQELQYHQTAQAQAESLLAAERQRAEHTLHEQATQWQSALRHVSEWGETAVEHERSESVEKEVQLNIFRLELHDAQEELRNWTIGAHPAFYLKLRLLYTQRKKRAPLLYLRLKFLDQSRVYLHL